MGYIPKRAAADDPGERGATSDVEERAAARLEARSANRSSRSEPHDLGRSLNPQGAVVPIEETARETSPMSPVVRHGRAGRHSACRRGGSSWSVGDFGDASPREIEFVRYSFFPSVGYWKTP